MRGGKYIYEEGTYEFDKLKDSIMFIWLFDGLYIILC